MAQQEQPKPIVLEKAVIRYAGNMIDHVLHVQTMFTAEVADALGARWVLFDTSKVVRGGFQEIKLDQLFVNAWAKHEIEKISSVELVGCEVKNLRALRTGNGKKKPKALHLLFDVNYKGNAFALLEHITKITKANGRFTIKPAMEAQTSLPIDDKKEKATEKAKPRAAKMEPVAKVANKLEAVAKLNTPDKMGAPVASFAHKSRKDFVAAMFVQEGGDGFYWAASATIGHKRMKKTEAAGPFTSEQDAMNAAANAILAEARPVMDGGERTHKKWANDLAQWALSYIKQVTIPAVAKEPADNESFTDAVQ